MSYGIPFISYKKYSEFKNNTEIIFYNNKQELINKILQLKKSKTVANKLSKNSYLKIKHDFSWNKKASKYLDVI